ncbi:MAG TPA: glycosyltransferase family 4 protein [Methylocella sp.]|nr:glycosyltransferase family 4 protein [Methylocella sp.]
MVTSEWPTPDKPFLVPFLVQQVEYLRRAGAEVEVFFFRGAKNPLNYFRAWLQFNWRYWRRRTAYDLVHAQMGQAALIPWPKRLPLIITFHGSDLNGLFSPDGRMTMQGRLLVWLGRTAARFADTLIVVSNEMRRRLPASIPLYILPTGVDLGSLTDLTRDEARQKLRLPLDEHLVLFVGDPANPLKRYGRAQQAIAVLNKTLPARLILGWNKAHDEIIMMMCACDALVVTSLTEGSPTIVKEALACNLPVVSVVVGDVIERLKGVDGCEIAFDDKPETIAAAVERVLRRGGRIKGRDAIAHLDEAALAERLIGIYRSVLRKAKPERGPLNPGPQERTPE